MPFSVRFQASPFINIISPGTSLTVLVCSHPSPAFLFIVLESSCGPSTKRGPQSLRLFPGAIELRSGNFHASLLAVENWCPHADFGDALASGRLEGLRVGPVYPNWWPNRWLIV